MSVNHVKSALREGKVQLGCAFAQLRSPEIPRILKAAGFHWAFVDMEHGNFDLETVQDICRVANLIGFCPVVRVPDLQYHLVARALDVGAGGILFPRVESPELLEKAISWVRFPPEGQRGFGLTTSAVNYEAMSMPDLAAHVNRNTLIVTQIETQRGIDARDELLSISGLDALMVGPADLSFSLGVPGDFQHSKMVDAMDLLVETCNRHQIAPGTQARTLSLAKFWKDRGMRFLGCSSETGMLLERATEIASALLS
ncbi:MAG: aldolase [Bryobacteraceae bacterium]|nr:aldolase [Bryobacteraceae bacterium]